MICIDIGSGYNPKKGYLTCDVNSYCDYHTIDDINDNYVDKFHIRNTLHHIKDLNGFITKLFNKLKIDSEIEIIDCNKKYFEQNLYLDRLWYRYIFNRPDIYIQSHYIDYVPLFKHNGFKLIYRYEENEKLFLKFKKVVKW
jgi:hypothetical protein